MKKALKIVLVVFGVFLLLAFLNSSFGFPFYTIKYLKAHNWAENKLKVCKEQTPCEVKEGEKFIYEAFIKSENFGVQYGGCSERSRNYDKAYLSQTESERYRRGKYLAGVQLVPIFQANKAGVTELMRSVCCGACSEEKYKITITK